MSFSTNTHGILSTGAETGTAAQAILTNFNNLADLIATANAAIAALQSAITTANASIATLNSGKANASTVAAHIANTSNPHSVTAAQTGAYTTSQVDTALTAKANASTVTAHIANTSNPHSTTYTQVGAAAASHTHPQSDVTGLTAALAAKADASTLASYLPVAGGTLTGTLNVNSNGLAAVGGISFDGGTGGISNIGSGGGQWDQYAFRPGAVTYGTEIQATSRVVSGVVTVSATSGTVAVDASTGNQFNLNAVDGNITLGQPTNPVDGQAIIYRLEGNASGYIYGFDMAYYRLPTDIATTLSPAITTTTYVVAAYNANAARWDVLSARNVTF